MPFLRRVNKPVCASAADMDVKENALCEWPFAGFAFNIRVLCDIATALYERPLLPRERFELEFGFVAWSQKYNLLEWHLSNIRRSTDRSIVASTSSYKC